MQQQPNSGYPNWQQEQNPFPNAQQQPYSQQPPYQQPWPQYPNQQAMPPVQPIVKKKRRTGLFIGLGALVVVLAICAIVGTAMSNATSSVATNTSNTTTQQQQPTGTWKTTQTFSGNGSKKTATFAVGNDWKIEWKCNPSSFDGGQYNLIIMATNSDNTPFDAGAVNTICKAGNVSGVSEEHASGNVFLDVTSEGSWQIIVQELK